MLLRQKKELGYMIGYVGSFFLATTLLYGAVRWGDHPTSWLYLRAMGLVGMVVIAGRSLRAWL